MSIFSFFARSVEKKYQEEVDRLQKLFYEEQEKRAKAEGMLYQHNVKIYQAHNDNVSVDFESMDAFSIERLSTDKNGIQVPFTNIGYNVCGESKEWSLWVSDEKHLELVREFNRVIKKEE